MPWAALCPCSPSQGQACLTLEISARSMECEPGRVGQGPGIQAEQGRIRMGWGLGDQSQEPPCLLLKSLLLACGHGKAGGAGSSMRSPSSLVWPLGSEGQLSGLWQSHTLVPWQVVCVWVEGSAAQQGCRCQPGMGLEGVWTAQSPVRPPCYSPRSPKGHNISTGMLMTSEAPQEATRPRVTDRTIYMGEQQPHLPPALSCLLLRGWRGCLY